MLDKATIKRINEFVHNKPRTVDEISKLLNVNWRTADRYVQNISENEGTIGTRTFRSGTRGALKVAYWKHLESLAVSDVQEYLLKQIETGRRKEDFSPSEILQFVDKNRGKVVKMNEQEYNSSKNLKNFLDHIKSARQQILFLSGNLTWSKLSDHDREILHALERLAKKNVNSKILTRVELAGIDSLKNMMAINSRSGYDAIEVRHRYQPLRCTIIDNSVAVLKEVLEPEKYAPKELKEKTYLLYYIYDPEWIEFLQKAFWHMFRPAVSAKRRMDAMRPVFHTA